MPPRGRGRGRGRFRSRPPAAIRSTMQELGLTSNALARGNPLISDGSTDASRAYFPPLPNVDSMGAPAPLADTELEMVSLQRGLAISLRNSPAAVHRKDKNSEKGTENKLSVEVRRIAHFYRGGAEGQAKDTMDSRELWPPKAKFWVIPEMLPEELRPRENTRKESECNGNILESAQNVTPKKPENGNPRETVKAAVGNAVDSIYAEDEKEMEQEDKVNKEEERGEAAHDEEEDDLELNADYETVGHFDDDDGYEEPDSGNEEATFLG